MKIKPEFLQLSMMSFEMFKQLFFRELNGLKKLTLSPSINMMLCLYIILYIYYIIIYYISWLEILWELRSLKSTVALLFQTSVRKYLRFQVKNLDLDKFFSHNFENFVIDIGIRAMVFFWHILCCILYSGYKNLIITDNFCLLTTSPGNEWKETCILSCFR